MPRILGEIDREARLRRKAELASNLPELEFANDCHDPNSGRFCERISSPRPTSVKEGAAHIPGQGARMSPDLIGDKQVASTIARQAAVPGFEDFAGRTDRAAFDEIIDRQAEHIVDAVDAAFAVSRAGAELHSQWYPKANEYLGQVAKDIGLPKNAVIAAAAVLSPGSDWADNLAWSQHVAKKVANQANEEVTVQHAQAYYFERLAAYQNSVAKGEKAGKPFTGKEPTYPGHIVGKKLSELSDADAAIAIRGDNDDEGGGKNAVRQLGGHAGFGDPKYKAIPQTDENITKAVSVLRNPSPANADAQLGNAPKVRSFYNNLRAPKDTEFEETTVDTHHYGLANGHPWGISSPFIASGAKSITAAPKTSSTGAQGTYSLVVEATRRATKTVNKKYGTSYTPNQVQSVSWEYHRASFPSKKRGAKMQEAIASIRSRRARGEITHAEEIKLVEAARVANGAPTKAQIKAQYDNDVKISRGA